ncbi:TatD family deoxyribonuclease [Thiohalocapsa marina]|uniref:TatD family deoxyribonuclease n=1 Tax=Thiohalocapsa marina TaxID=424902 RepID=A0A5M8FNJ8_9GAMM|nr:TatD family hydrolase [Thiohalocapsa marina]KAA6186329.1 TatD family deoxyribonuclease [Thiohalocapsa marina]
MLVDSHCHLDRVDLTPYQGRFDDLMRQTRSDGVGHMLCVCIDLEHYPAMRTLVADHPDVSVSVGVHPNETAHDGDPRREPDSDELVRLAADPRVVAIGETGLDYHYNQGDLRWQRDRFRVHIDAARRCGKPLIIHTRAAREDTIDILRDAGARDAGGVMHCFTETWEMASAALDLGFYISFSGILTFKNAADLREVARQVPLDRLLIETDSPYLAPVPHRGKPNEPRFVRHVADQVAELRGMDVEEVVAITGDNFFRLFAQAQREGAAPG